MTQPSDRARKAAWDFRPEGYGPSDADAWFAGRYDDNRIIQAFDAFERDTFAAWVEAAAKCAEDARVDVDGPEDAVYNAACLHIAERIRNLTPAPPADLCADIAQKSGDAIARLEAENARLLEALTPSNNTKHAYIGEFEFVLMVSGPDEDEDDLVPMGVSVPWTTIKAIMAAIRDRAALTNAAAKE